MKVTPKKSSRRTGILFSFKFWAGEMKPAQKEMKGKGKPVSSGKESMTAVGYFVWLVSEL